MNSTAKKFEAPKLEKPVEVKASVAEASSKPVAGSAAAGANVFNADASTGRRRVPRRVIENRIGILHRGNYHVGWAYEIGEGGLLIAGPVELKQGDRVVLTVRIPEAFEGVISGTVVYHVTKGPNETHFGIKFDDIDFDNKRKIRNFVASGRTYVF